MIIGKDVATVGNGAHGCTFKNQCYEARLDGTDFLIYDTAGLNEGDQGRVPHSRAVEHLYTLIRELDGVSLLVYCLRGRAKENTEANWILFNKIICAEKVPIIAVVTGLEEEDNLDDWWRRDENRKISEAHQVKPLAVACIVSIRGRQNEFEEKYKESQEKVRHLIAGSYRKKPWSIEKDKWFGHIFQEVYTAGLCFSKRVHLEFVSVVGIVVDEFLIATPMKPGDSDNLKSSLLHAEKKVRRRRRKEKIQSL